jgi:hypothetical protein
MAYNKSATYPILLSLGYYLSINSPLAFFVLRTIDLDYILSCLLLVLITVFAPIFYRKSAIVEFEGPNI